MLRNYLEKSQPLLILSQPKLEKAVFQAANMHVYPRLFYSMHFLPEYLIHPVYNIFLKLFEAHILLGFLKNFVAEFAYKCWASSARLVLEQCIGPRWYELFYLWWSLK